MICKQDCRVESPARVRDFSAILHWQMKMHRLLETLAYIGASIGLAGGRAAVRLLPRRWLLAFFRGIADLGFHLAHGFRTRSIRNLSLAFGDRFTAREIADLARSSLRNFSRDFLEMGFALDSAPDRVRAEIPVHGLEHLKTALAKGKGAIALSAHLGNFFLLGTRLAAEGYPTYVLINQARAGKLPELIVSYRNRTNQKTIHAQPHDEAFRELVQVLKRNELAIVIADEFRNGDGIRVPFFGRSVIARRGPATLALRTGAAVVPACLVRDPAGDLKLVIEPEIELSRTGKVKADVTENTLKITQWLEKTLRAYPDQWNWMTIHWQEEGPDALMGKEHRYRAAAH
jgi:KDO2-lipid IV(A) lauroyltransferase